MGESQRELMTTMLQQRIQQHQFISDLRIRLLRLHKTLLEMERIVYEQKQGQVSKRELLRLVLTDAQFDWLHRLSRLIVRFDDLLHADEPVTSEAIDILVAEVAALLTPAENGDEFAQKYEAALQLDPDVVLAHADVTLFLASRE
ncbi:hypothetical protein [Leptolyngbya sp. FACHB-711]|uniref:hypothetical protein n=1 Tax=Leptolyngbya sp. FACHB-711 TaxID=2692813 RepID=UPI001F55A82B|nr:hypothetical protein [Leptolyngbya sp. FACHB-711]